MFVMSQQIEEKSKIQIIYNKKLPMGSIPERYVTPILDCCDSPKGSFAYKTIFEMSQEKKIVSDDAVCVTVTPFQKRLLDFITTVGPQDFADQLLEVQELATYYLASDVEPNLEASHTMLLLHKTLIQKF